MTPTLLFAIALWGFQVTEPIEFRWEPLNACNLRETPTVALTQVIDTQTTMHFDDGTSVVTEHAYSYLIRLNSNCDWSKIPMDHVIAHEYGHILLGADYHSANKHSIMYPVVNATQDVMPSDLAALDAAIRKRGGL